MLPHASVPRLLVTGFLVLGLGCDRGRGGEAPPLTGHVICWGLGQSGQLGIGTGDDAAPTAIPTGADDLTALFAGSSGTCGARQGGGLTCWGDTLVGEPSKAPRPFTAVPGATAIAIGSGHACALAGGRVLCWGRNLVGQLGNGAAPDPTQKVMIRVGSDGGVTLPSHAVDLTGGDAPVPVTGLTDAIQIAAGKSHTCALRADHTVVCWGSDANGQLGDGRIGPSVTADHPVAVAGLTDVAAIAAGGRYSCARLTSGGVTCWGSAKDGFGNEGRATPMVIAGLAAVGDVAIQSEGGACATVAGGDVRCWREDEVASPRGLTGATQLTAGMEHTCARLGSGQVTCWGSDFAGVLAQPTDGTATPNAPIARLAGVTQIASGARHVCALRR